MSRKIIVEIGAGPDGFRVTDAQRREHCAKDASELGKLLAELLKDGSMPPVEESQYDPKISVAVGLIGRVAPRYRDLVIAAEPLAQRIVPEIMRRRGGQ